MILPRTVVHYLTLRHSFHIHSYIYYEIFAIAALAGLAHVANAVGVVGKAEGFATGVTGGGKINTKSVP